MISASSLPLIWSLLLEPANCLCVFAPQNRLSCKYTYTNKFVFYRVIILHLLRSEFDQDRGTLSKNSNRINVDRFLEIGRFCDVDVSGPAPFVPRKTRYVTFRLWRK
jgi:hypothetical protein